MTIPTLQQVQYFETTLLGAAEWNARKSYDRASLDELIASIDQHGIQTPLIVRLSSDKGSYEVVCGHRRLRAASLNGMKTVPCIVRELTNDQAREIGLVDNLQREDVPALEEADAYAELQQRLGTAAAIAQRVGKEASYVARRLQLVSLAEQPRKALAERLITVEHAALLARLGEDEQNTNLKWTLNPNSGIKEPVEETIKQRIQERDRKNRWAPWEPESVLSLKHHIEEHVGRKLSRAPWDLDDATLIKDVPACNNCPSNTKHNDTLFGDLNIAAATCENGGCFEMKRLAFVSIRLTEATHKQEAGRGPSIRLSWKATTVKPRISEAKAGSVMVDESGINLLQVFKRGQWVEAKPKSCEHVRLGVTVDWSDANDRGFMGGGEKLRKPGQVLNVCIAEKCKAHRKEWEKPKSESPHEKPIDPAEAERARKSAECRLREERAIRTKVLTAILGSLDLGKALRLAADQTDNAAAHRKMLHEMFPKAGGDLLEALVILDHQSNPMVRVNSYRFENDGVTRNRKDLWGLAKSAGVDADQVAAKHFHDAGSIAPACDVLYPKGVKWPKVQSTAAKKAAKPAAKKAAKKVAKKKGGR